MHEDDQTLKDVASILDTIFYQRVAVIADNALLVVKKEPSLNTNIYGIHADAVRCFFQKQYEPTVFYASIGVERYLNKALHEKAWIPLNFSLIKKAYEKGIVAVTELLDKSEKNVLRKVNRRPYPTFCFCGRRNKILHGDIAGLVKIKGIEIKLVHAETISMEKGIKREANTFMINYIDSAYDQLLKFQKFLLRI